MEYQFVISGTIGESYDWWTGQKGTTTKDVRDFLNAHKGEDVHVAVSSPGGYVDSGLEIYQLVKDHGSVHMHIMGMTASAATFLTMGAKSVDMVDGSLMLIHNASTAVMEWQSANKKELDAIIEKYQKEREDLDTIDKVIANIYARKSGKTLEECLEKMDRAAWLSPQDALDFGLIDEIRTDDSPKKQNRKISNYYLKEYGLPPIPSAPTAEDDVAPTKSLFKKSVDAMKSLFQSNEPAINEQKPMIKIFTCVMALLSITDGFKPNEDGSISLTQDQMKTIDDQLGALGKELKDSTTAKDELQKKLDEALENLKKVQDDLASANEQIENLKGAPGDSTEVKPADSNSEAEDFLTTARNSFERIKDI